MKSVFPCLLVALWASVAVPAQAGWLDTLNPFHETEIIPLAQGGAVEEDSAPGMLPFTTFEAEQRAVTSKLPCKWISMGGGQGEARYDFLCKGGTWATVSLMLDRAVTNADGVGRVRFLFREWPETVHPGGGEAYVAQQFLQHVTAHFIPANMAKEIEAAFWYGRNRVWRFGPSMRANYSFKKEDQFVLRRLEIRGFAKAIQKPGAAQPQPAVTPTEAGLGKAEAPPRAQQPQPKPILPLPKPVESNAPVQPKPLEIPEPLLEQAPKLENATAAEVHTAPEPESKVKPEAPEISTTLIPSAEDRIQRRPQAPTNFNDYNKAEQLTKEFEAKAAAEPVPDKVKPAESAQPYPADAPIAPPATTVDPTGTPTESLQAMPNPSMESETAEALQTPKTSESWPQGEGLGNPSVPPEDQPVPEVDKSRFAPTRSLPQLKFIPKAVPLEPANEIIQFEDESSGI